MQEDILEHIDLFHTPEDKRQEAKMQAPWMDDMPFRKYEVNVAVDNGGGEGANVRGGSSSLWLQRIARRRVCVNGPRGRGRLHRDRRQATRAMMRCKTCVLREVHRRTTP